MGCLAVLGIFAVVVLCWASLSWWAAAGLIVVALFFVPVVD